MNFTLLLKMELLNVSILRSFNMNIVVTNKKKELKNAWKIARFNATMETMDDFLIKMFVMFSYDNLDEPPFLLGKELQEALDKSSKEKFNFINGVLGG